MVHQLLERPDDKVKFFGALTVIIKLNKERCVCTALPSPDRMLSFVHSSSLSDHDASELLVRLIGWYLDSLSRGRSALLVSRKLSSAIATFFIHFHQLWPHYIRHLIACLASSQPCDPASAYDDIIETGVLSRLDSSQTQAVLGVATCVMEDLTRLDFNAPNKYVLPSSETCPR